MGFVLAEIVLVHERFKVPNSLECKGQICSEKDYENLAMTIAKYGHISPPLPNLKTPVGFKYWICYEGQRVGVGAIQRWPSQMGQVMLTIGHDNHRHGIRWDYIRLGTSVKTDAKHRRYFKHQNQDYYDDVTTTVFSDLKLAIKDNAYQIPPISDNLAPYAFIRWEKNPSQECQAYIGQVSYFHKNAPEAEGWVLCDGRDDFPIKSSAILFSIFGTTHGGNGRSTMGLPTIPDIGDYQARICYAGGHLLPFNS